VGKAIRARAKALAAFFGLKPLPVRIERPPAHPDKP
jgi:hypothetical protein